MEQPVGRSVLVSGQVQGVFYRASAVEEASSLGLTGWVKNLPTGEVQIEVFGSGRSVDKFMVWCKKGPPLSRVVNVEIEDIPYQKKSSFKVVY